MAIEEPSPLGVSLVVAGLSEAAEARLEASIPDAARRLPGDAPVETQVVFAASSSAADLNAAIARAALPLVVVVVRPLVFLPAALARISEAFAADSALEIVYTDEAVEQAAGELSVVLKPDPAPERLRNQYFWGQLVVARASTMGGLGGFREGFSGAEAYDFALRATRSRAAIAHLAYPAVVVDGDVELGAIPASAVPSVRRALEEHLAETGGGVVRSIGTDGVHDTVRTVQGEPLISIVIPTRGQYLPGGEQSYLIDAIESIVELSTYGNYEIVVVIDDVADQGVIDRIRQVAGSRLHLVPWTESFNFSGKINLGALNSIGEYLLILNDDVRVLTPDWLQAMLTLVQLPNAGMSGCMLYYEDDTIQHAGHHYWRGDTIHVGMNRPRGDPGPTNGYRVEREVVGITAACAMMPRSVYLEVGGMTTLLPGAFNDVDLCLKVLQQGYDILWTPHAELYHYESKTRDARVRHYEVATAWGRWEHRMHQPGYWPYPV